MLSLFDYIFYRVYKHFREKDNFIPDTKGSLILSLIQIFTVLDFLVIIRLFYEFPLPGKIYILPLIVVVGVLNWYRYEKDFDIEKLEDRWGDEEKKIRVRNGWLIILYILFSFSIPITYSTF